MSYWRQTLLTCAILCEYPRIKVSPLTLAKCNSGGLGLVGGIIDVGGLSDCLNGIFQGKANLSILDRYDTVRREKYDTIVNPISSENFRRLWDQDPEIAAEKDPFLQLLQQVAGDPEKILEFQMVSFQDRLLFRFTDHSRACMGCSMISLNTTRHPQELHYNTVAPMKLSNGKITLHYSPIFAVL